MTLFGCKLNSSLKTCGFVFSMDLLTLWDVEGEISCLKLNQNFLLVVAYRQKHWRWRETLRRTHTRPKEWKIVHEYTLKHKKERQKLKFFVFYQFLRDVFHFFNWIIWTIFCYFNLVCVVFAEETRSRCVDLQNYARFMSLFSLIWVFLIQQILFCEIRTVT